MEQSDVINRGKDMLKKSLLILIGIAILLALTKSAPNKHVLSIKERIKRINNFVEKQKKYMGTIIEDGWDLGVLIYLRYYETTKNIASTAKEADLKEVIKELDKADINYKVTIMTFLGFTKHKLAEKTLLELMNDENELIRNQAISVLIISGNRNEDVVKKAIEIQKKKLKSENRDERNNAVRMLQEIGGKKAAEALLLAINDVEPNVRQKALYALEVIGKDIIGEGSIAKELISHLQREPGTDTISVLAEMRSKEAVPKLVEILQNDSYGRSREAAEALGKIGDEKAIPFLIKALNDEKKYVCLDAAQSLGLLGNKEGYEIAIKYIGDEEWTTRSEAVKALEYIGDEKALPILEEIKKKESQGTMIYKEICKAIINIKSKNTKYIGNTKIDRDFEEMIASLNPGFNLGFDKDLQEKIEKITGMKMKDILIKMIEDFKGPEGQDRGLRENAISLLGAVEGEAAYPVIFKLLKDENAAIRRRAIITLQRLNYRKEEVLQEIITNETDDLLLGDAIRDGLGIGNDEILKSLIKILETKNHHRSKAIALEALSIIAEEKILIPILKKNINNADPYLRERAKSLLDLF